MWLAMWIAIAFGIISALCGIIGLAIPFWATYYHFQLGDAYYGLWISCNYQNGCTNTESTSAINAVRALESFGVILILLSVLLVVVRTCGYQGRCHFLVICAGGMSLVSGIVLLIGDIVFGTEASDETYSTIIAQTNVEDYRFHAGLYLSVIAGVFSIMTGCLFCALPSEQPTPILGLTQSRAAAVTRTKDTGLYFKSHIHRESFITFQPNVPGRFNVNDPHFVV